VALSQSITRQPANNKSFFIAVTRINLSQRCKLQRLYPKPSPARYQTRVVLSKHFARLDTPGKRHCYSKSQRPHWVV